MPRKRLKPSKRYGLPINVPYLIQIQLPNWLAILRAARAVKREKQHMAEMEPEKQTDVAYQEAIQRLVRITETGARR